MKRQSVGQAVDLSRSLPFAVSVLDGIAVMLAGHAAIGRDLQMYPDRERAVAIHEIAAPAAREVRPPDCRWRKRCRLQARRLLIARRVAGLLVATIARLLGERCRCRRQRDNRGAEANELTCHAFSFSARQAALITAAVQGC